MKILIMNLIFYKRTKSFQKNVLRGLHFQKAPFEQSKLIRVIDGKILDVVVDLRKKSNAYGKAYSVELSSDNGKILFIPKVLHMATW